MRAYLHSVRLAPKKVNLLAKMIRGKRVPDAVTMLERTAKKSARVFEKLLRSAIANASHNFKQDPQMMIVKSVIVNQGTAYHRGVPMARGRVRPIRKFMSHIEIELGYAEEKKASKKAEGRRQKAAKQDARHETRDTSGKTDSQLAARSSQLTSAKKSKKDSASSSSAS